MNDSYLNTFEKLFFNIDENEEVQNIIEQASYVLASLITKFGEVENELCYGTSRQDDFIDTVICLFIRKIVEQLDAINVLFSVGSTTPAQIILRTFIENVISLEFILKEDTKNRAAAYFLEHHYQEIELGLKYFDKNSEYAKLIIVNKGQEQFSKDFEEYKRKEEAFKRLVNSKEIFKKVDAERRKKLNAKRKNKRRKKVYIQWYEVCSNVTNFYELMKETGYERYYQSIYGGLSYETHALNSVMDVNVSSNGITLKPIRNPEGASSTFTLTCTLAIGALNKLYEYLKDGEEERKEFRSFFMDFQQKRDITSHNLDMIRSLRS